MNQDSVREALEVVLKENGMKLKFVADKLGISYNTFSRWKCKRLDFGAEKLNQIRKFITDYKHD